MGKCDLDISTKAPENMGGHCIGFNTLSSDWNQKTMLIKPVLLRQQLRKGRIEPAIEKSTKKREEAKLRNRNDKGACSLRQKTGGRGSIMTRNISAVDQFGQRPLLF